MPGPCIVVVGATGTGKSAVALWLAGKLEAEIVNLDVFQAYRGLEIGTAAPTVEERAAVPHHLYGFLEPHESMSAGAYARRCRVVLDEIRERGRTALVVGGSGFYLRALFDGLSPIPAVDGPVREALRRRLHDEGVETLYAELADLDPEIASRLHPRDAQRVIRALEVGLSTGVPLSAWQRRKPVRNAPEARRLGLTLDRALLYDRLASRAFRMLETGWLDEVRGLLDRGVSTASPAFRAIGYRELASHLLGELSLEAAMESIVRATRRYAKRQITWFRREPAVTWFDAASASLHAEILQTLDQRIAGRRA